MSTVFQPRTPTNTDTKLSPANKMYLRHLIERGYGWEDIVVKCRSIPLLRGIAPDAIRSLVLRFPIARRPLRGGSGRFAACDGAAADAER